MLTLKSTQHSYIASATNEESYIDWKEFETFCNIRDWDRDLNCLYRFDLVRLSEDGIYEAEDEHETEYPYTLILNFIHQRKGTTTTMLVKNISEEDVPAINRFLKYGWDYLKDQWAEISVT